MSSTPREQTLQERKPNRSRWPRGWPTLSESAYVLVVVGVATWAFFIAEATVPILLAFILVLPTGPVALIAYYVAYGLLAQVPGANPSEAAGTSSCSANGHCETKSTGDLASWFTVTTDLVAVLLIAAAAVANLLLIRVLVRSRSVAGNSDTASEHPAANA